jgi:hypothetical protein
VNRLKTEVISFREFMSRSPSKPQCIIIDSREVTQGVSDHLKKHRKTYTIAGLTLIFLIGFPSDVFAVDSRIDISAKKMYKKLIEVGKWVIIFKGGMECIQSVTDGDFPSAKKKFLGYLLIYALLFAFPWLMDEIEKMFDDIESDSA